MNVPEAFTRKLGPLPVWAWGVGAGVGLALYRAKVAKQSESSPRAGTRQYVPEGIADFEFVTTAAQRIPNILASLKVPSRSMAESSTLGNADPNALRAAQLRETWDTYIAGHVLTDENVERPTPMPIGYGAAMEPGQPTPVYNPTPTSSGTRTPISPSSDWNAPVYAVSGTR